MNRALYDALPRLLQEAIDIERDEVRVATMAVAIASESIAAALQGLPTGLSDLPKPGAPAAEWHSFFMQAGANRLHKEGVV